MNYRFVGYKETIGNMKEEIGLKKKTIIIGGGVAGLASAVRLQSKGYDVEIYEKESTIGGKMNQIKESGFTFDTGPTIVMMPEVYKDVFRAAGKNPDDYMEMQQLDPIYSIFYSDGERVQVSTDLVHLTDYLEGISEKDSSGYLKYVSETYDRYLIAKNHFIDKTFRKPTDFYNPSTLMNALRLKTFDSAYNSISKYIEDDKLKKLLSFQTLYIGISPYNGPSIYNIIPLIEMIYGVWFIKGGMYSLIKGMEKLFLELGGTIHTNMEVDEILISEKSAYGIRIGDSEIKSDIVLCDADFPYAMKNLIADEDNRKKYTDKKIDKMDYSCSCLMFYLGIDHKLDQFDLHNILFSADFDGNIEDIFEGRLPKDASMYFYCPSKLDDTLAPVGQEALYILIPIPNLTHESIAWDEDTLGSYREEVFRKIETLPGMDNFRDHIVFEKTYTPKDFKEKFNTYNGATFGLSPTLMQSNYFRPQNKFKEIENLYFAGSSVHPGAGVPIVLTSAKLAVENIRMDFD